MTKNEMLTALQFEYGDSFSQSVYKLRDVLIELVKRLPTEAPKIEDGPNTNLQD